MNSANRRENEAGHDGLQTKSVGIHLTAEESSDDEEVDEEVEGNDENAISVV